MYIDMCHGLLYDFNVVAESSLPPVYVPPPATTSIQGTPTKSGRKAHGGSDMEIDGDKWKNKDSGWTSDNLMHPSSSDREEHTITVTKKAQKLHKREDALFAPRSLFDRPTPAMSKLRRDYQQKKYGRPSTTTTTKPSLGPGSISFPISAPKAPTGPPPPDTLDWFVAEDNALLQVGTIIFQSWCFILWISVGMFMFFRQFEICWTCHCLC